MTESSAAAIAAAVRLMVMYDDESVAVRLESGAQLQLSPCGCDFLLDRTSHRVRQRTRFTVSAYRELMIATLKFRNMYSSRPYLPQELIPAIHKKPFFSIDSCVQWPDRSSCDVEVGPGGETIIRSVDGKAVLILSPSGEEFSVEFTCNLSKADGHFHTEHHRSRKLDRSNTGCLQNASDEAKGVHRGSRSGKHSRSRSCSSQMNQHSSAQPKPEEVYQSTTVVQHHSCSDVAPVWRHPLSLAHHHMEAHLSKLGDVKMEEARDSTQEDRKRSMSDVCSRERSFCLPQALPLTCASPHWHRWKFKDPLCNQENSDQEIPVEPIKVMWCEGVTYRILSGTVSAIEVSPGDGSVIRSNSVLNSYFIHHRPELHTGMVNKVTYHVNSLPPDVPGQVYSVRSVLKRAYRILTCSTQARKSLMLPDLPSCLQEYKHFTDIMTSTEENLCQNVTEDQHVIVTQMAENWSKIVAAELRKITF
ncbi:uncharacterized protein C5orf34 homolog isoform X2 [Thalassophryne amazonica]|uniref:uncharacterized protein C5orf34 homolog isoform X2 n=1 Tax=Thalassophryne amazonica TaxID=390379 RepID=UPI0014726213|nr:uncharacterized protein C5orf34 homolog isoform X2 [Thalassophryne amazonica]